MTAICAHSGPSMTRCLPARGRTGPTDRVSAMGDRRQNSLLCLAEYHAMHFEWQNPPRDGLSGRGRTREQERMERATGLDAT
jgi:hypothetical protein